MTSSQPKDEEEAETAVAVEEVPEVVVSCKLAAEDRSKLAKLVLGERMTDFPHMNLGAKAFEVLDRRTTGSDVYKNSAFLFFEVIDAQQTGDIIGLEKAPVLIEEHDAIGIAVVDDSDIAFVGDYGIAKIVCVFTPVDWVWAGNVPSKS